MESLLTQARKLEKYIVTLPAAKRSNTLASGPRQAMQALVDASFALRQAVAGYEQADDTSEQSLLLEEAALQAKNVAESILIAGEHDLIGPADVAHLDALTQQVKERLA